MSRHVRAAAASAGFLPAAPERDAGSVVLPGAVHGLRAARRLRWNWTRALALAVALYSAYMGFRDWRTYPQVHASVIALQRQEAALVGQQKTLQQEITYDRTQAYISSAARQEFGLVKPGQVPLAPVTSGTSASQNG